MLALAVIGPPAVVGTGLELWLKAPGQFVLVAFLMAGFLVYGSTLAPARSPRPHRRRGSVAAAVNEAEARFVTLIAAGAIVGLVVAAGLHLRLLPGFALLGLLALTGPVISHRGLTSVAAIREGFTLAQRNLVGLVALGATTGALSAGTYMVAAFLFSPLPTFFDGLATIVATITVTAPFAATAFSRAFALRSEGTRLTVRPTPRSGVSRVARATGQAVESAVGGLARQKNVKRRRVAYVAGQSTSTGLPRYAPDAATMTLRGTRIDSDEPLTGAETDTAYELPTAI